ncbi:hypothetical protein [Thiolapillus sp.]
MKHIHQWDKGIVSGYEAAGAKIDSQYSWYGTKPDGTLVYGFELDHYLTDYKHYDPDSGNGYTRFKSEDWLLRERGASSLGHYKKVKVALSSAYHLKKRIQMLWIRGSRNSGDEKAKKDGPMSMYNPEEWFIITEYKWHSDGELSVSFEKLNPQEN